jgi:predicted nucleic acid-binding protein
MPEPEPKQKNNKQKSKKNDIQILEYFEPLRVVVDTCVFVSAKIGKSHENFPLQVINKWREENFFLITSEKILAEVILKLDKKFNYPRKEISDYIDEIYCNPNTLVLED